MSRMCIHDHGQVSSCPGVLSCFAEFSCFLASYSAADQRARQCMQRNRARDFPAGINKLNARFYSLILEKDEIWRTGAWHVIQDNDTSFVNGSEQRRLVQWWEDWEIRKSGLRRWSWDREGALNPLECREEQKADDDRKRSFLRNGERHRGSRLLNSSSTLKASAIAQLPLPLLSFVNLSSGRARTCAAATSVLPAPVARGEILAGTRLDWQSESYESRFNN